VIEPVIERLAGNRDAKRARVGEVGEAEAAGRVLLAEDHFLLRPRQSAPSPHAPLQRAPDIGIEIEMAAAKLLQHRDRANARRRFEDRHDLALPNINERIRSAAAARHIFLRRQARIGLDPVTARGRDTGFGGGDGDVVGVSEIHEEPHLVIVDALAGQTLIPRYRDESAA